MSLKIDSDDKIVDLLQDSFKKLESTTIHDSKQLADMNNALNWILTLTTFMYGIFFRPGIAITDNVESLVFHSCRILFSIMVVLLIIHKMCLVKYESAKGFYLETLRTHLIEIKFNLKWVRPKLEELNSPLECINAFRDGRFIPRPNEDERVDALPRTDRRIKRYGKALKVTFTISILAFVLYFSGVVILMTHQ